MEILLEEVDASVLNGTALPNALLIKAVVGMRIAGATVSLSLSLSGKKHESFRSLK